MLNARQKLELFHNMGHDDKHPYMMYVPSLSSGASATWLRKNTPLNPDGLKGPDGLTGRFYTNAYPQKWRKPYFLLSAGHNYKKFDLRKEMGLEDSVCFGDSGGFQIATGAMKGYVHGSEKSTELRKQIFEWLENNSDIAVNLDIPPRFTYEGQFAECLDMSFDNFKFFESNQTGKTTFLNVLQGNNPNEYEIWYKKVKDFQFGGWCIGGARRIVDLMYAIAMFLRENEFNNKRNQWMHVLGVSKISDFVILATLQSMMNKYYEGRIIFSTDSSSPGQYPVYGVHLMNPDYKNGVFGSLHIKNDGSVKYPKIPWPCNIDCPACKEITLDRASTYDEVVRSVMVVHNTFIYHKVADEMSSLMNSPIEILEDMMPNELYSVVRSIHEMFANPDRAIEIYKENYQLYISFSGDHVVTQRSGVLNEFFSE